MHCFCEMIHVSFVAAHPRTEMLKTIGISYEILWIVIFGQGEAHQLFTILV